MNSVDEQAQPISREGQPRSGLPLTFTLGFSSGDTVNNCRSIVFILALISLWTLASDAGSATMNKCSHPDGQVEFTDRPCPADAPSSSVENKASSQPAKQVKNGITSGGLPAEDRLKSCEPSVAIAAAEEIVSNPANLKEPLQLFSSAFAFFQNGRKDEGVFWFYAAQLRVRQQIVLENGDRGQLLSIMLMTMGPYINNYAFQNISNFNQILDRVLEWDKKTTNPFREKARSQKLDKQIDQVYAGFSELKTKLATEKNSMEAAARQAALGLEQMYTQTNNQRCRKGQPDPALENQTIENEWLQATDFVKGNKDVIREVGSIKGVGRESSKKKAGETLPSRYIVSVGGDRSAYAVINVSRLSGNTQFTLACLTHLSLGMRDPFKDECKQ